MAPGDLTAPLAEEPITGDGFRYVLGHLPTGVTAVTAYTAGGPVGMAANSVTSVSLNPPLILFCAANTSTTWPAIRAAGQFCVTVMASHQADLSRAFSRRGTDRFAGASVSERTAGPALDEAVAWLDCRLHAEHLAGDHVIVIAEVFAIEAAPARRPLVFYQGRYGTFAPGAAARQHPGGPHDSDGPPTGPSRGPGPT